MALLLSGSLTGLSFLALFALGAPAPAYGAAGQEPVTPAACDRTAIYFCQTGNMESSEAATAFAALSQDARLNLMRLLMAEGPTGLPAGELANRLGLPASTTSFHLAALERAGLTQSTRQGRQIIHAARIAGLRRVLGFLTETCCGGRPELCGDLAPFFPHGRMRIKA